MQTTVVKSGYLEANNVCGYEHADALDEVSQSMDEGSSDSQAAVRFVLVTWLRWVWPWRSCEAMRVAMAMRVEVTALVQQEPHSKDTKDLSVNSSYTGSKLHLDQERGLTEVYTLGTALHCTYKTLQHCHRVFTATARNPYSCCSYSLCTLLCKMETEGPQQWGSISFPCLYWVSLHFSKHLNMKVSLTWD